VNRLSKDTRFTLTFAYQEAFIPNACTVTILDDGITLQEIADRIYAVAEHAVIHNGVYLAGSPEDRYKHKK